MKSRMAVFIIGNAFFAAPLMGASYYVSVSGSDSNAGTLAAPFLTLQKGVNAAKAGDTVIVENGTYAPTSSQYTCGTVCSQNGFAAQAQFNTSGTSSAPITIMAQNKWGAILDCGLPSGYSGNGTDGVHACDAVFNFNGSASYITIKNFDVTRAYWDGAMINGSNNHDIKFIGNHFHHIGNRYYNVPSGTTSLGIVGVYAGTGSSNITWDSNQFNNIGRLPQNPSNMSQYPDDYSHDHGLYIYNGPYTITNNIYYGQAAGWDVQTAPGSHDIQMLNNTMIGGSNPDKYGCNVLWGQNTNVLIQNNILYNCVSYAIYTYQLSPSNVVIDHNIIYGAPSGAIDTSGVTNTNNRLNTDPKFTSTATPDYHLLSGSPAIDTGVNEALISVDMDGNARPQGAAFDVGAYEYGSGATFSACDVNKDGSITTTDITAESGMAMGAACTADVTKDGNCNVLDVQRVVNATLPGGSCVSP